MRAGVGVHRLEQQAGLLLAVGAPGQLLLCAAQAQLEVVAQDLELTEVEQPRPAAAADRDVEGVAGERGDERVGQAALEPGDLGAQRAACGVLLDRRGDPRERVLAKLLGNQDHDAHSSSIPA